jgi:23S rRNA (cytosine1962-C5)-methyltransferase
MTGAFILKPGREKSLLHRHPWIFSGAIARFEGEAKTGDTVDIRADDGRWLARGAASPSSQIRARVWTFDPAETIDEAFFARRIAASVARRPPFTVEHHAARLIHGESDGLPGVIVDRYADVVVVQILAAGAEQWRETIFDALVRETGCSVVFERSEAEVRALEGLPARTGIVRGTLPGETIIVEHDLRYRIDVAAGQKTGFFLDQRDNRRLIASLAAGREALDCFTYTGGFALSLARGGAKSVIAIDSSSDALAAARTNAALNGLGDDRGAIEWLEADVFKHLRQFRDRARTFDLIVLDPPKLAPTAQHVERAARAYKDINLLAFKLLSPGGLLATFSCSGAIGIELFQKIVAGAAVDAKVDARVIARLGPSSDHPVLLAFPEGDYLKGLLVSV